MINNKIHLFGYFGLLLIAVFWPLNWLLTGLRTHWGFFFLWLGYSLFIDGLVYKRKGTSLLKRNYKIYIGLFFISAPCWWLFELINQVTHNWFYVGKQYFTDFQFFLLASLSFSTVMPAVFGTAEFTSTFSWLKRLNKGPVILNNKKNNLIFLAAGILLLLLILIFPKHFYPFVWLSIYLIVEPLNFWFNNKTILSFTSEGNWKPVISLFAGCLITAFFWEMWNFYSYPKWIYYLPMVNNLPRLFEMPLPGYIGYFPFALELFALYHLVIGFFINKKNQNYLQFE